MNQHNVVCDTRTVTHEDIIAKYRNQILEKYNGDYVLAKLSEQDIDAEIQKLMWSDIQNKLTEYYIYYGSFRK